MSNRARCAILDSSGECTRILESGKCLTSTALESWNLRALCFCTGRRYLPIHVGWGCAKILESACSLQRLFPITRRTRKRFGFGRGALESQILGTHCSLTGTKLRLASTTCARIQESACTLRCFQISYPNYFESARIIDSKYSNTSCLSATHIS